MMLTRKLQGLPQKSLTVVLTLGLLGGRGHSAVGRQAIGRPCHDGAGHSRPG
jgi:hypothetical protein